MTDADLIYNAMLRAERKAEEALNEHMFEPNIAPLLRARLDGIRMIREEIGNGLAEEGR